MRSTGLGASVFSRDRGETAEVCSPQLKLLELVGFLFTIFLLDFGTMIQCGLHITNLSTGLGQIPWNQAFYFTSKPRVLKVVSR